MTMDESIVIILTLDDSLCLSSCFRLGAAFLVIATDKILILSILLRVNGNRRSDKVSDC